MANEITATKQKIKEMILKDSEITKILLDGKENNYENVKGLVGKNIFNYINDDCTTDSSIRISYDVDYTYSDIYPEYPDDEVSATIIIQPIGLGNPCDEMYNSYTDILSEKIVEDVLKTFKPVEYFNVAESTEHNSIRRKIKFTIK